MAFPDDFPNLLPTARELEQLWRRADNTYKSCWSCPNDHDHTDDKSSPCPQCGKPRQKLVKTTSIKDALQRKSQSPEFFDALKHGPSLYKSFKDQEPNDDTPFWSFWHGDGVRRLEEKGCDLTITDNYLPIVVGLFIDGWKPCGNDYSIASITLRVYNLPGKMATKKTCLIPLCHVDGPGKWKRPMLHLSPVVDELLRLGVDGFRVRWTKHHPPCRVQGQTRHHQLPNFAHRSLFQRRQEPTASAASKICTYLDTRGLEPVGVWMQSGGSGSEGKLLRRHKLTPTHICLRRGVARRRKNTACQTADPHGQLLCAFQGGVLNAIPRYSEGHLPDSRFSRWDVFKLRPAPLDGAVSSCAQGTDIPA